MTHAPSDPGPAHAATIAVTTTADEFGTGAGCSLREAVQAANTDAPFGGCTAGSGDDTITLPAGTYARTIADSGEDVNATGDLGVSSNVTIAGAGAASTVVDANDLDRVLHALGPVTVTISGVTMTNGDTISGGAGNSEGGGIFNGGTLSLTNSTLSGNSARSGGGIFNFAGTVSLRATVLDTGAAGGNCAGSATSQGSNIADDASCFGGGSSGDQVVPSVGLGPLAANGGPTRTHALLDGSPAIDAVAGACPPPATDQRGQGRPQGLRCDAGAFERQGGVLQLGSPWASS